MSQQLCQKHVLYCTGPQHACKHDATAQKNIACAKIRRHSSIDATNTCILPAPCAVLCLAGLNDVVLWVG
eukprot:m.1585042 g.1585042  ORF g.1585042 m.1585042 type:complete len:70 (-) comp25322_c0_seq12:21-230(-)